MTTDAGSGGWILSGTYIGVDASSNKKLKVACE